MNHPYKELPDRAFWKRAISTRHYQDIEDLWMPPKINGNEKFGTAGSCFAQHIGRHISSRSRGNYLELEVPPLGLPASEHSRFGYGIYSCRYGNIYTSRQLVQITQEAFGKRGMSRHVWERSGRYYDALRPSVDPVGLDSPEAVVKMREFHLKKVREMFESLDIFVFTLGLTEAWVSQVDGTAFPTAPGVIAGSLQDNPVVFENLKVSEVVEDLSTFWDLLGAVNPSAKMILTVSPVPLIATASGEHVLTATSYSKSVLRVAAQELATEHERIYYFPSYEIVNSAQGRGYYFEPDLRTVNDAGVSFVMSHFFTGAIGEAFPMPGTDVGGDVVCDEESIEKASR